MRLGFHTKQLTERGTEVALFDYALAASQTLGHDVTVFVPAETPKIIPAVKRRFEDHFELVLYSTARDITCDALYVIKRGSPGLVTDGIPELVHSFHDASHPHGHRFATVSEWVSQTAAHEFTLPDLADDLREELSLPAEAVIFGRHGGLGTFSIEFVKDAIRAALEQRDDLWFLFVNVEPFCDHPRVMHLSQMTDRAEIRRFVNTCDYMIHAHLIGETFGLAVAEFAFAGVPVMTYVGSPRLAQLDLLSDELLLAYLDYDHVLTDLTSLPRRTAPVPSDIRERYSVERVMKRFREIFLD
jgi:hypothetical protein